MSWLIESFDYFWWRDSENQQQILNFWFTIPPRPQNLAIIGWGWYDLKNYADLEGHYYFAEAPFSPSLPSRGNQAILSLYQGLLFVMIMSYWKCF